MASLRLFMAIAVAALSADGRAFASEDSRSKSFATVQNLSSDSALAPTAFDGSRRTGNMVYAGEGGKFAASSKSAPKLTPRPKPAGAIEPPSPGAGGAVQAKADKAKADDDKKKEGGGELNLAVLGAAAGGLIGAAIGFLVGGPIGAIVGFLTGALVGALFGALAQKARGG